jgi:hypothetical protein
VGLLRGCRCARTSASASENVSVHVNYHASVRDCVDEYGRVAGHAHVNDHGYEHVHARDDDDGGRP